MTMRKVRRYGHLFSFVRLYFKRYGQCHEREKIHWKIKEKTMYNMIRHLNGLTEERTMSFWKVQTIYYV